MCQVCMNGAWSLQTCDGLVQIATDDEDPLVMDSWWIPFDPLGAIDVAVIRNNVVDSLQMSAHLQNIADAVDPNRISVTLMML